MQKKLSDIEELLNSQDWKPRYSSTLKDRNSRILPPLKLQTRKLLSTQASTSSILSKQTELENTQTKAKLTLPAKAFEEIEPLTLPTQSKLLIPAFPKSPFGQHNSMNLTTLPFKILPKDDIVSDQFFKRIKYIKRSSGRVLNRHPSPNNHHRRSRTINY